MLSIPNVPVRPQANLETEIDCRSSLMCREIQTTYPGKCFSSRNIHYYFVCCIRGFFFVCDYAIGVVSCTGTVVQVGIPQTTRIKKVSMLKFVNAFINRRGCVKICGFILPNCPKQCRDGSYMLQVLFGRTSW